MNEADLTTWTETCIDDWQASLARNKADRLFHCEHGKSYAAFLLDKEVSSQDLREAIVTSATNFNLAFPTDYHKFPFRRDDKRALITCHVLDAKCVRADFWQASPSGKLFLLNNYYEDNGNPGTSLCPCERTIRVAFALSSVGRIAKRLGASSLEYQIVWDGLRGRQLQPVKTGEEFSLQACQQAVVEVTDRLTVEQLLDERLIDTVVNATKDLFREFDEMDMQVVIDRWIRNESQELFL